MRRGRAVAPNARAGFTVVEMLVAILILTVGVLGLAGVSAMIARMMNGAAQQTLAAASAQSHFDRWRGQSCTLLTSGADTVSGITTSWTSTTVTRGRDINMTVTYRTHEGAIVRSFRSIVTC